MRVGLVGAGLAGRQRAKVVREFDGTDLVMVADVDAAKAKVIAEEAGSIATTEWRELVARDDIDIVIVSTPNKFLSPISVAAMRSGKHVLCEKPLGRNPEEVQRMVETAQGCGVTLKSGFNHRYHAGIRKARDLVDRGIIGELGFIRCQYGHGGRPGYEKEWRADLGLAGGGELLDQGIHAIDLFRWFMGDFEEVAAFKATLFWDIAPMEDNAFGLLRTARGQIASLHVSWTQWRNLFSFEIFGREGYILVNGLGGNYGRERVILGRKSKTGGPPQEEMFESPGEDQSWHEEWKEFVVALQEGREPQANGYEGWQAIRLVFTLYEAATKGCIVKVYENRRDART